MEDFIGKFRVWREGTSKSPSGRHLGHYKTLIKTTNAVCERWEQDTIEADRVEIQYLAPLSSAIALL
jgi:hypothetical protein